jgi:hypothetical protein
MAKKTEISDSRKASVVFGGGGFGFNPSRGHIGRGGGLVEKHQSGWVKHTLLSHLAPACARHVRPLLLRRPQTFFDADLVVLKEVPHRAATTGDPSLVHRCDDYRASDPVAEQSA